MRASGNTILVTGGGSGIGRALAQRWHDAGNTVIVTGRRAAMLAETVAGRDRMHAVEMDVSRPASIAAAAAMILRDQRALNVLVNNAGIMMAEDATAARDLAPAEAMVATNLLGPIRLTDALVDHLKVQPDAAIINVSSGLAFVPYPTAPTYSATKAALHAYTLALRARLAGTVELIEIAPPMVRTELTPGQSHSPYGMDLDAFADEVMALLAGASDGEIMVRDVLRLRHAERDGTLREILAEMIQRG